MRPARPRHTPSSEAGLTLIEVMVAAAILMVGILSTFTMVDAAQRTTQKNSGRTAASNLAREVVEQARSLDYDTALTPATLVAALRTRPGLAGEIGGDGRWVIKRQKAVLTITASVCTFDDPMDGLAASPPANACPAAAPVQGAPAESNPDDFRRIGLTIDVLRGGKTTTSTHSGLVANPTGGKGPRVVSFPDPFTLQVTAGVSIPFVATTTAAAGVRWSMDDGVSAGDAQGGPTLWGFNWDIGTMGVGKWTVDGTYTANVQPFDARGVPGEMRVASILLNRRVPLMPTAVVGGRSQYGGGEVMELEWAPNPERDVIGYRVYRIGPALERTRVCPSAGGDAVTERTSCTDPSPDALGQYQVVAVDRPTLGVASSGTREGDVASFLAGALGVRPAAPVGLQATLVEGRVQLTWTGPTPGVLFYRIYRDGDRIDRTVTADPVYIDPDPVTGTPRTYAISAVGATFNESPLSQAVTIQ